MTHEMQTNVLGDEVTVEFSGPWTGYWIAFLRLIAGWWFLHAGLDKIVGGFDASGWLIFATKGSIVAPITVWFGNNAPELVSYAVMYGEFLIGLGLIFGALTRLAAFFGAFLMSFFYFGNAAWAHGFVNGDLLGLLLFATIIVFGAGRVWGLDEFLERTSIVQNNRWMRYLLG